MTFLAGDIGGTKVLLALYRLEGEVLKEIRREKFVSKEYPTFDEIVESFLKDEKQMPQSACFGIAGAIVNGVCHTTNLPWVIDCQKLSQKFNIPKVNLINDLVANAYGINTLSADDLFTLNKGSEVKEGNLGLISAGTGLGLSPIPFCGGDHVPSPSEGGHRDFSPRNDLEIELLQYLWKKFGHASTERVLSGQGMVTLYQFLIDSGHEKCDPAVTEKMKQEDPAKVISQLGASGECVVCEHALNWFCGIYGSESGNFALTVMTTGGLYVGGGIAPKILKTLEKGEFMSAFIDKGRFSEILQTIPVHIILEQEAALKGAAYFCQKKCS